MNAHDQGQGLLHERTRTRLKAEHRRRLRNQNVARNADEKARRNRNGQEVGDEAEPERAAADENDPDHHRERRGGRGVMVGPRPGERGQRASENGRNGRIRADRKAPARAEQRKPDRARGKREEANPRRQPGEAGGRHLRGDGDCGQRQAGEGVRLQIAGAPAGE